MFEPRATSRAATALLQGQLDGDPDHPVLRHDERTFTRGALAALADRFASALKELESGSLVALWLPNGPELLALYLACFQRSLVPMPLAPGLKWPELQQTLQLARPDALLTIADQDEDRAQRVTSLAPLIWTVSAAEQDVLKLTSRHATAAPTAAALACFSSSGATSHGEAETPCLVLHTSGSTGLPKGVVLPRRALRHILEYRLSHCDLGSDSVCVVASCVAQSVGLYQCLALLAAGSQIVLLDSYQIEPLVQAINTHRPSHLILVVSAFDQLLHHPELRAEALSHLRFACAGADRLTSRVQRRFMTLTGRALRSSYGLSESSWALINDGTRPDKALALGRPSPGVELELRNADGSVVSPGETGEIHVRSPRTLLGYLNDPRLTAEVLRDGWLATGDLAHQDPDGWYWFDGRSKDLIVLASGDVVSPAEVEATLRLHPSVGACLVTAQTTSEGSQVPWAFVVAAQPIAAEALREFLKQRLSDFKIPRGIELVSELPLGLSGKVQRLAH
jgi:long-chain acyl-CoA synthetase